MLSKALYTEERGVHGSHGATHLRGPNRSTYSCSYRRWFILSAAANILLFAGLLAMLVPRPDQISGARARTRWRIQGMAFGPALGPKRGETSRAAPSTAAPNTHFVGEHCVESSVDFESATYYSKDGVQELRPGSRLKLGEHVDDEGRALSIGVCPWLKWDTERRAWLQPRGPSRPTRPEGVVTGCEGLVQRLLCMARRGDAVYSLLGGSLLAAQVGGSWGDKTNDGDLDIAYFRNSSRTDVPHPECENCTSALHQNWDYASKSDLRYLRAELCLCQFSGQIALCRKSSARDVQVESGMSWWVSLPMSKGMGGLYPYYAAWGERIEDGYDLAPTLAELHRFVTLEPGPAPAPPPPAGSPPGRSGRSGGSSGGGGDDDDDDDDGIEVEQNEHVGLSHFLDIAWEEADTPWLEHTLRTAPCVVLNAFREIHAAYFFLKEVIKLDGADLAYNRKHWPNTKPPLPRADVYTMSLQPQCTLILAEADLPERRARYFDYRWDFDSPRRENIVDKRHRWEGNASKDLMERSENDLERGLKKYLGYWGGMPARRQ